LQKGIQIVDLKVKLSIIL